MARLVAPLGNPEAGLKGRSAPATRESLLAVEQLVLGFDGVPILDVPHLTVAASDVVSIVGASGLGKTTFLTCLSGHLAPLSGTFSLNGSDRGLGLRSTFVSRTAQNFPLFHWLTVRENLALAARVRGVRGVDYDGILATFSAEGLAGRFPTTLSGGERSRASLSQALLGDPQLLLLDEPFTGLDFKVKLSLARNLFRLARASGAAVLFVTHDLNDAVEFSDRVVVLGAQRPATVLMEVSTQDPQALEKVRAALGAE